MRRNRKKDEGRNAERDAQVERARQLRERIAGVGGSPRPKSPRELTDEAAMKEFLDETEEARERDPKKP